MSYDREILDRKVGRNAQLFARAIARLDTPRDRFPYLRILVTLVEKAHPEWEHSAERRRQVVRLVGQMAGGALCEKEVTGVVAVRDDERAHARTNSGSSNGRSSNGHSKNGRARKAATRAAR